MEEDYLSWKNKNAKRANDRQKGSSPRIEPCGTPRQFVSGGGKLPIFNTKLSSEVGHKLLERWACDAHTLLQSRDESL